MQREECLSLLQLYDVPYRTWRKDLEAFLTELERKQARLVIKRLLNSTSRLVRMSHSAWVYVRYIAPDGTIWELYEVCRIFPNNDTEDREHDFVSETINEGESGLAAALRALLEEAGFLEPDAARLHPYAPDRKTRRGALLPIDEHESFAYAGILTAVTVERYVYYATGAEFNGGAPFESTDEYGVCTRVGWRKQTKVAGP